MEKTILNMEKGENSYGVEYLRERYIEVRRFERIEETKTFNLCKNRRLS